MSHREIVKTKFMTYLKKELGGDIENVVIERAC